MKSFQKFRSRALNNDILKTVKGGIAISDGPCHDVSHECGVAYDVCTGECSNHESFMDCVWAINQGCSPLIGYDNVCINNCPIPPAL